MKTFLSIAVFGAFAFVASPSLLGASLLWQMENGDDSGDFPFNTTRFTISNTSDDGAEITGLRMTVGNLSFNFDVIYGPPREAFSGGSGVATLLVGDRNDENGIVTDVFEYSFAGLVPNVSFRGQFDIDEDAGSFVADARTVLFSNGDAPNAVATFRFSNGPDLEFTFPDLPAQESYAFHIPEPAPLRLLAFAAVAILARRRERSHSIFLGAEGPVSTRTTRKPM